MLLEDGGESVMDLMKDERPRAVTGSRNLSEFWFESFLLQFSLHTSTGYCGVCRELKAVLLAQWDWKCCPLSWYFL